MKDIKKLNSALNDIDERLIEEAAQGGRARSVPGWVKYGAVIAGGAAAVIARKHDRTGNAEFFERRERLPRVFFDLVLSPCAYLRQAAVPGESTL